MDLNRLRGEIVAEFRTQRAFAAAIGWHQNKVTKMLTGKYKPDTDEVAKMATMLHLDEPKFCDIFLPKKSPVGDNVQGGQVVAHSENNLRNQA